MTGMDHHPPLEILYHDDDLVAVTKPGNLLVHRTPEAPRDRRYLLQTLARQIGRPVYPVHRLDRAASGAIVFGLGSDQARRLHDALKAPEARKEYLVLVRGETPEAWSCARPLTNRRTGVRQPARSTFERIAVLDRLSLLRARIFTGRRHQIRRHLHHAAHQVIGDTTYGKGRINQYFRDHHGLPRLFLHARTLVLAHPSTGQILRLDSRLPDDLKTFLLGLPGCDPTLVASLIRS